MSSKKRSENFEAFLHTKQPALDHLPIAANPTHWNTNWCPSYSLSHNKGWRPSSSSNNRFPVTFNVGLNSVPSQREYPFLRSYQGFCQICGLQSHTAKRCISFHFIPVQASMHSHHPKTMATLCSSCYQHHFQPYIMDSW